MDGEVHLHLWLTETTDLHAWPDTTGSGGGWDNRQDVDVQLPGTELK